LVMGGMKRLWIGWGFERKRIRFVELVENLLLAASGGDAYREREVGSLACCALVKGAAVGLGS